MSRPANRAGSWYSDYPSKLREEVRMWTEAGATDSIVPGAAPARSRFLIGPHAGYCFCAKILGQTYSRLDPATRTVFILSPSHTEYLRGVRVSRFERYETPLGDLQVDTAITAALHRRGVPYLAKDTDILEHGIEMHLPFLHHAAPRAKIVPIVVGEMEAEDEADDEATEADDEADEATEAAQTFFARYINDDSVAFVVSTDFCHWGKGFEYRPYRSNPGLAWASISRTPTGRQIWESIMELDGEGMAAASSGDAAKWRQYIQETGNTVCGQAALGLLMATANSQGKALCYQWLGYKQSVQAQYASDDSVSYASAAADLV